jgi:hypothetical protein
MSLYKRDHCHDWVGWDVRNGDSALRDWIKALPLSLGLPIVIGAASVKPEDAASNVAAWLHLIGVQNVPDWLSAPGVDNRVILGSAAVGVVYAFLIWGIPALRRPVHSPPSPPPAAEPTRPASAPTQTIRHAFSERQSIKVLPPFLGGNMTLRLDNVATLRLHAPYSMQLATMILDVVPMDLAVQHSPNVSVDGAQGYFHSDSVTYVFDVNQNKRKEIVAAGRTFIVTLLEVKKIDRADVSNPIEYVFGISEK